MKLATLGAATLITGIVLSITGLILAGGLWIVTGVIARAYGTGWERESKRARGQQTSVWDPPAEEGSAAQVPSVGGWWFAGGSLIFMLIGLPSLAIGIFEVGIEPADSDWRWLPIAVGGLATGVGVVSTLMYALGSGLEAAAEAIGVPEHPGTITIRAVRDTGTYINERPRLEFDLTVHPEGLPSYDVTKKATVPFSALSLIRPGDGFKALVLPEKPDVMEIDWSSPIPGS